MYKLVEFHAKQREQKLQVSDFQMKQAAYDFLFLVCIRNTNDSK